MYNKTCFIVSSSCSSPSTILYLLLLLLLLYTSRSLPCPSARSFVRRSFSTFTFVVAGFNLSPGNNNNRVCPDMEWWYDGNLNLNWTLRGSRAFVVSFFIPQETHFETESFVEMRTSIKKTLTRLRHHPLASSAEKRGLHFGVSEALLLSETVVLHFISSQTNKRPRHKKPSIVGDRYDTTAIKRGPKRNISSEPTKIHNNIRSRAHTWRWYGAIASHFSLAVESGLCCVANDKGTLHRECCSVMIIALIRPSLVDRSTIHGYEEKGLRWMTSSLVVQEQVCLASDLHKVELVHLLDFT